MKYVKLGRTGLTVSRIALGMMTYGTPQWRPWVLEEEASRTVVRHAVEQGINFFDTADMYSAGESEVLTGKFVREFCRREEVVIATKAYYPVSLAFKGGNSAAAKPDRVPNADGLSRKRLFHAVDESLQRLGTDYIDLWQIHRLDHDTPIEETMEALHDIVKSGKVRYIGASSMYAWQFAKAQQVARENRWTRFVSMQNHYNLAYREEEREMIPLCHDQGVGLIPWSPLARGFLAGNRKADDATAGQTSRAQTDDIAQKYYYGDSDFAIVQALTALAQARGLSNATLAYAWLLHKGITGPIVGASKTWQIDQAVAALDVALTHEEMAQLEAPYRPHPILGHV
ncbi:aldo/keto reductase [Xenophilus arseniciresistens]|uniref:Aldo/keto reductase n=1 Tax=Xenophilus arseniciresistens TaxID=1283306 RepID=A0AAE3NA26_9BURK|nr:aldo/keto reductase [Xenophilus arseniciresistens]MDA7417433.1 aldo/keto reductase [Xenophilus arseniciresistens]